MGGAVWGLCNSRSYRPLWVVTGGGESSVIPGVIGYCEGGGNLRG